MRQFGVAVEELQDSQPEALKILALALLSLILMIHDIFSLYAMTSLLPKVWPVWCRDGGAAARSCIRERRQEMDS